MAKYQVVVSNVGTVYDDDSLRHARLCFNTYVDRSRSGRGRAGNETVTLFDGESIIKEFVVASEDE